MPPQPPSPPANEQSVLIRIGFSPVTITQSTREVQHIDSTDAALDPFQQVDEVSLSDYASICRALVRAAGDSARRIEEVLAERGLTPDQWGRISASWTDRIRRDPTVRAQFKRHYAGLAKDAAEGE